VTKDTNFKHPPGGHVAGLGYDSGNDRFQVVHVNAAGQLQVYIAGHYGTLLVQQYMPSLLQPGINTYDGAAWRKQPLVWGFSSRWSELATGTSTGGAATNAVTVVVPAGYVYVLESWTILHDDTANRAAFLTMVGGAGNPYLYESSAMVPNVYLYETCHITLQAGDILQLTVWALANTKKCYLTAWGHKMQVNM